jgi:diphthine synthase
VKILSLERGKVEDESIISEAKEKDISLLIYGDVLAATTHLQLIQACKDNEVEVGVYHNASVMTSIAETGLSLYKFGKTASMPSWKEHTNKPTSFMNYIKQNKSIGAHTLLLIDIGLELEDALEQLKEASEKEQVEIERLILCSALGTKEQKIYVDKLPEEVKKPYCLIVPGDLDHIEEEFLGNI